MPADETFGSPVPFQVDGREIQFPRLYMDFYGTLEAAVRSARTAKAEAVADSSGLKGKERAEFVMSEVRPDVMVADVDAHLCTESGAKRVIEKSLDAAGVSDKAERAKVLAALTAPDATWLARRIVGFLIAAPDEAETVEKHGHPKSIDWDAKYVLILKHFPGIDFSKLTWNQFWLCEARAAATERATNPQE